MKENDEHLSDTQQSSTAHAIGTTSLADKRAVENPKSTDLSEKLLNEDVPHHIYECAVEDTGEIEEMCIENESFIDVNHDGSCFSNSKETMKYPSTSECDELFMDHNGFACNTQG